MWFRLEHGLVIIFTPFYDLCDSETLNVIYSFCEFFFIAKQLISFAILPFTRVGALMPIKAEEVHIG